MMVAILNRAVRGAVSVGLRSARLPLSAVETVTRRGRSNDQWPPAIAFERFEAGVKDTVGRLTGDETLVGLARLQRAETEARTRALKAEAVADATLDETREEAEAEQERIAEARQEASHQARKRRESAEEARRRKETEAAERAQKRRTASRKAKAAHDQLIDEAATEAEARRLRAEAEAIRAKEKAVAAEGEVLDLDKAARAKKSARQAG